MKVEAFLLKIRRLIDSLLYIGLIFGLAGVSQTGFTLFHQPPIERDVMLGRHSMDDAEDAELAETEVLSATEAPTIIPIETIPSGTELIIEETEPILVEDEGHVESNEVNDEDAPDEFQQDVAVNAEINQTPGVDAYAEVETERTVTDVEPTIFKRHGVYFHEADQTMYITRNVNVRSGPGMSHGVIGRLPKGQAVEIIGVGISGNHWNRIIFENSTGYVYSEYLSFEQIIGD